MDKEPIKNIIYQKGWLCVELESRAASRRASIEIGEQLKKGMKFDLEIKLHREKRSQDANAYFWTLIGKLAAVLRIHKDEIYREMIRGIGDNFEIMPVRIKAVDKWCQIWESKGVGWLTERTGSSKLKGYENVICYYGSSTYDTAQMSRLIDLAVQECKEQGIDTLPPEKIALLKESWNE